MHVLIAAKKHGNGKGGGGARRCAILPHANVLLKTAMLAWDVGLKKEPSNQSSLPFSHSQQRYDTSEDSVQIKNLPEIISERHSQLAVSCPWDVKDSCIIASRYELTKPDEPETYGG